jgi:glutamate-1-semialdehyde aminotransferase/acyl carrier protein
LEEASGIEVTAADEGTSFLDLGLDSLFLTQVALTVQRQFSVKMSFRQLIEEYPSVQDLAAHLDRILPPDPAAAPSAPASVAAPVAQTAPMAPPTSPSAWSLQAAPVVRTVVMQPNVQPSFGSFAANSDEGLEGIISHQLRVMEQQMALLSGAPISLSHSVSEPTGAGADVTAPAAAQVDSPTNGKGAAADVTVPAAAQVDSPTNGKGAAVDSKNTGSKADTGDDAAADPKKPFGAMTKISLSHGEELTSGQRSRLDAFSRRYNAKTAGSKRLTQENRRHLADPRAVSGFRPILKELVYPLVVDRSSGSKFWDVDGNEYIDVQCGFGSNLFGWSPPFIINAIKEQLDRGIEIGPQHPMAGEVAALFCELTGAERAAFCNTGSEAVMGALRIARTVTGRSKVVIFTGDYHGVFDEVLVRGTKKLKSLPAAPGIMSSAVENMLVLDYGVPESLAILEAHANELAAVMVEPVQSRRPDLQPREFLQAVRKITEKSGTPMIFDEVVTGMRIGPGGAQAHFGVRADIATYGKIVGGGLPIGVLAGRREYMDALDGGFWQYGDDSVPTVGVTYFAGTFVRHPAALAAARAVLTELKARGPALQDSLSQKVAAMATELNAHFSRVGVPLSIKHFGSLWKPIYSEDLPFGDLLATYMRDAGIHMRDGFPCFLTTAHSDADVAKVVESFKSCVAEMQASEFLPGSTPASR